MESKGNWIKLHRSIEKWEWRSSPNHFSVFMYCLESANWEDKRYKGDLIPKGSFPTSHGKIAEKTGLTIRQVRSVLSDLKKSREIVTKSSRKGTVITVVKWENYQGDVTKNVTQNVTKTSGNLSVKCQENVTEMSTTKNIKNYKNVKNSILDKSKIHGTRDGQAVPEKPLKKKTGRSESEKQVAREVKLAYQEAYRNRYQIEPVWAAKENTLVYTLVGQVGGSEAKILASQYPSYNDRYHLDRKHPFQLLVNDVSKIRVELKDPRRMLDAVKAHRQIQEAATKDDLVDHRQQRLKQLMEKEQRRLNDAN